MTKLLAALFITAAILLSVNAMYAQSFDVTCPGGIVMATPTAEGVTLICVAYTPTPTPAPTNTPIPPTATSTPTRTATPTPIAPPSTATPVPGAPVVAFPGAEGFGAASLGGRGGRAIEVTNLNDAGTGSLRACIIATGARTCIFKVAGTITLASRMNITSPFITIAGQTAPGGGIVLRNGVNLQAPIAISTHNVIIRHLRLRPGPPVTTSSTVDGLTILGSARYVILDHLTISWSADEAINTWETASDITVQWSFIYNELCNGWHGDGHPHCDSMLLGSNSTRISAHHNLLAHNDMRNPRITGGEVDFVNNVIYDAGTTPARLDHLANTQPGKLNFVGNYIKRGPDSYYTSIFKCGGVSPVGCYVTGNSPANVASADSAPFLVTTRYPFPQVTTTSAIAAYDDVLDGGGATKPSRDSMDTRIANEVRNGTGGFIDNPSEVGGYPVTLTGTGYTDSDKDGISSAWELNHGLDPNNVNDGNLVSLSGYTFLELFLAELAQ